MLRIGLTGPTGSGKSTVTALMRRWGGIEILDADTIAHGVNNSPACTAAIAAAFPGTRLPDGTTTARHWAPLFSPGRRN